MTSNDSWIVLCRYSIAHLNLNHNLRDKTQKNYFRGSLWLPSFIFFASLDWKIKSFNRTHWTFTHSELIQSIYKWQSISINTKKYIKIFSSYIFNPKHNSFNYQISKLIVKFQCFTFLFEYHQGFLYVNEYILCKNTQKVIRFLAISHSKFYRIEEMTKRHFSSICSLFVFSYTHSVHDDNIDCVVYICM